MIGLFSRKGLRSKILTLRTHYVLDIEVVLVVIETTIFLYPFGRPEREFPDCIDMYCKPYFR